MSIFVIGCTHFGHKRIIELANRPFISVEEMDLALVERWNAVVSADDLVIHLGDFMFYKKDKGHFDQLNGTKTLILGNHDHSAVTSLPWAWTAIRHELVYNDRKFVLDHYPNEDWNGRFHGSVHLHAHTHSHIFSNKQNRFCVGAEAINYTPISLDGILLHAEEFDKNGAV